MTKKDAYYFPHFSNARNDQKLIKLRRVMGIEGYGLYFMLLEVLRDQDGFKYPLEGIEELAYDWHISKEKIAATISNFNLFEIDNDHFFSLKFNQFMQPYIDKSERYKQMANKRWGNTEALPTHSLSNTQAMPTHSISNASKGEDNKGDESILNNSKVKESKIPTLDEFLEYSNIVLKDLQIQLNPGIIENKYKSWVDNGWKDGYNVEIISWKTKIRNTIPHLIKFSSNDKKLSFTEAAMQY